jgi:hypothetical protein
MAAKCDIKFEKLTNEEKKLLLSSFNYKVDEKGFVIDPHGDRVRSTEVPTDFLKIEQIAITPGSINIIDGTPTSISKFIRELKSCKDD